MKQVPINSSKQFNIGHGTHVGMIRTSNEDSYKALCYEYDFGSETRKFYLNMIADGAGGGTDGKRASLFVIESIERYFDRLNTLDQNNILAHICQAVALAQIEMEKLIGQDEEFYGATTIAICIVLHNRLFTSHIGVDRIYLLRDGELYLLSKDHTFRQRLIDAGLITLEESKGTIIDEKPIVISPGFSTELDQTMQSPPEIQFEQGMLLQKGDMVLICSDGLTGMIDDSEIKTLLIKENLGTQERVNKHIEKANLSGGFDNITAILLEVLSHIKPDW